MLLPRHGALCELLQLFLQLLEGIGPSHLPGVSKSFMVKSTELLTLATEGHGSTSPYDMETNALPAQNNIVLNGGNSEPAFLTQATEPPK